MKLSAAFGLLIDLRFAIQSAFMPTLKALFLTPSLLFRPNVISRTFMAHVWDAFGASVDEVGRPVKEKLIRPHAYGVVLDIGAGHGHTIDYLDHSRVSKYIALEPNTLMHAHIRARANAAGYFEAPIPADATPSGTLVILSCGAEDTEAIIGTTDGAHSIDTLVSILTLCSVPAPKSTLGALVEHNLRPGGQLLFYEHVRSARADVVWWQRFWTPLWACAFDGCRLDRPTDVYLREAGRWRVVEFWGKEGEDVESLFWHQVGRLVKEDDGEAEGLAGSTAVLI